MCFSILSAIGDGRRADAQQQMAGVYAQNGQMAMQMYNQAATDAVDRGKFASSVAAIRSGQQAGDLQAAQGASGLDGSTGTAADQLAGVRTLSQFDQAAIRNNAAREAWGLKVRGLQAYQEGNLKAYAASNDADASTIQMLGDGMKGGQELQSTFLTGMGK